MTAILKPSPFHTAPWLHPEDPLEVDTLDHTQIPCVRVFLHVAVLCVIMTGGGRAGVIV